MASDKKYVTLTEENFKQEVLDASQPVLVDSWADWCGPCQVIAPVIDELAEDFDGQATIGKVNVDDQPGLAERFGIRSIPTVLFFEGGQAVDQVVGAAPKGSLLTRLKRLLPAA